MRRNIRDPFDDGGTPMWRARQVIEVYPGGLRGRLRRLAVFYRTTSAARLMAITLVITFLAPMAVLFFGILGAYWFTGSATAP